MDASFEDLGWLHYTKFSDETKKVCLTDLSEEDEGIVQTTIIKVKESQ